MLQSIPAFPNEVSTEIFKYIMDFSFSDAQNFEGQMENRNRFKSIINLRLTNRLINSEVLRILKDERPDLLQCIKSEAFINMVCHWRKEMENPGPEIDLFVKNVFAMIQKQAYISLDIDAIFKRVGENRPWLEVYDAVKNILNIMADYKNSDVKKINLKIPVIADFKYPESEYIFTLQYSHESKFLFSKLEKIIINSKESEVSLLLDLKHGGLSSYNFWDLIRVLESEKIKIEKLDLSNNLLCNRFMTALSLIIQKKPFGALYLRNLNESSIETLFYHLNNLSSSAKTRIEINFLDVSGSVINEYTFNDLYQLIYNQALIRHIDLRDCSVNDPVKINRLRQAMSMNPYIKVISVDSKHIHAPFQIPDLKRPIEHLKTERLASHPPRNGYMQAKSTLTDSYA